MECVFNKRNNEIVRIELSPVYFALSNVISSMCEVAEFFGADSFVIIDGNEESNFSLSNNRWSITNE